jgi:spore germination protein KC
VNRRFWFLLVLIVFCLYQLTGCWSRKEINRLSIIAAGAIDQANDPDQCLFTVEIVNPATIENANNSSGETKMPSFTVSSAGFTLADAERHLYKQISRPLFWQHMRVLIISEAIARHKIAAIIDYLDRITAWRRKTLLLVTPDRAGKIIATSAPVEKISGQAIYNLALETIKHSESYYPSDINDFLIALSTPGLEAVLARLTLTTPKPAPSGGQRQTAIVTQAAQNFKVSGSAAFKADKMIGWLDATETQGLLWVQGKAQNLSLILKFPGSRGQQHLLTVINQRNNCKIKPEYHAGKLSINLEIEAEGRTSGVSFTNRDFTQPAIIEALDSQYAAAIRRVLRIALAKAQKQYYTDIFGFGLAISRKYPRLWSKVKPNWDQEFPRLKVALKVTAHIRRIGLTSKPIVPQ